MCQKKQVSVKHVMWHKKNVSITENGYGDISSFLSSFTRRQGIDNLIILQVVVHSMKRKQWKMGVTAVKLDLAKSYDCVDWGFLRNTLTNVGFEETIVNLIMFCVTSTCLVVLWNGEKLESFLPKQVPK